MKKSWSLVCLLALVVSGCAGMFGMSPERRQCLNNCAQWHDGCVLSAHDAPSIQQCDVGSRTCTANCPP
jgi:hypothetical protein